MTKFKAGDKVTFIIDEEDAFQCNQKTHPIYKQIIKHEPAPEPIVGYVYLSTADKQFYCGHGSKTQTTLRLTYCPATGKASAEVV